MYLDKRKRYVLYATVAIVSIVALIIVICEEIGSSNTPEATPTPIVQTQEQGKYIITNSSKDTELINEFNDLYQQSLITDGTNVKSYIYPGEEGNVSSIITPGKGLTNVSWNRASVDLFLPDLHVGTETKEAQDFIDFFDVFINGRIINDARETIKNDESIDSYTGTYGAYVRTVTDSISKNELPIFTYMVKTQMHSSDGENNEAYSLVYDLKNGEKLTLKKMLDIYGIDWRDIKDAINRCINDANKNIEENVYKRVNDDMFYNINENYNKFVVNEKGDIYIYFCYGNKGTTVTNAMDVIKITNNDFNKNSIKSRSIEDEEEEEEVEYTTEEAENEIDINQTETSNEIVEGQTDANATTEGQGSTSDVVPAEQTAEAATQGQATTEGSQEGQATQENIGEQTTE